jgi:hypothetical protein
MGGGFLTTDFTDREELLARKSLKGKQEADG